MQSFKEVAFGILKKAKRPLHYKEITEIALRKNLLKSSAKAPEATMHAQLIRDINLKKENSCFIKTGPSTFTLKNKIRQSKGDAGDRNSRSTKGALIKGMSKRLPSDILDNLLFKEGLEILCGAMQGFMLFTRRKGSIILV